MVLDLTSAHFGKLLHSQYKDLIFITKTSLLKANFTTVNVLFCKLKNTRKGVSCLELRAHNSEKRHSELSLWMASVT